MSENAPLTAKKRLPRMVLSLGLVGAGLAIAVGVWVSNGGGAATPECAPQLQAAAAIDSAAQGELAAVTGTGTGRGYSEVAFQDGDGQMKTIGDFKGKALLVNFWASWCIPCREEMPALNTVAGKYNDADFEVLPVNLDIGDGGIDKARKFLADGNWPNLPLYADPTFKAFDKLKTEAVSIGLPTSLLLDGKGCEIAVLQGPAPWDTPDGDKVVEALKALVKT
ncbi:MAG TPA: TlpA disulfide reductase family protein [Devosiaceae bacterium]|jgi:thiol-disulfide isomerase/thioredoxin